MSVTVAVTELGELVERARALAAPGERALLGMAGAPGAGKSTLAEALVTGLGGLGHPAVLVPMDGFHLADRELDRLGRRDRKGAADTFDAAGYVALLRRLRNRDDEVVYAPVFDRTQEQSLAGALPVPREVPLVLTEGNYLLADGAFSPVRGLLTATWYLDLDPAVRRERLVERHVRHGRTREQAEQWALGTDERNAEQISRTRDRADLVVELAAQPFTAA